MTTSSPESKASSPSRFQKLGSNLFLGLLVAALSVFTAATNFATYKVGGTASGYETEGNRLLADSNTEYIIASQDIIQDYTMFDGYIIHEGVDEFNTQYYQDNFSGSLQASIDRGGAFDDQYYEEMYSYASDLFDQAFEKFDQASFESEREAAFQLAMLFAAVGLAFAAYASLLDEKNNLRPLFALMALVMLGASLLQSLV